MKKIKEFLQKDILPDINLRKKFPNYFNMGIIRAMWLILLVLLIGEWVANDGSFTAIYVECKDPKGCINPFYQCPAEYLNYSSVYMLPAKMCVDKPVFCENDMCQKEFLTYGEKYGRKGLGLGSVLLLLAMGLGLNHINWIAKGKP